MRLCFRSKRGKRTEEWTEVVLKGGGLCGIRKDKRTNKRGLPSEGGLLNASLSVGARAGLRFFQTEASLEGQLS